MPGEESGNSACRSLTCADHFRRLTVETSGCPGPDGRVACNRPYGNEKPVLTSGIFLSRRTRTTSPKLSPNCGIIRTDTNFQGKERRNEERKHGSIGILPVDRRDACPTEPVPIRAFHMNALSVWLVGETEKGREVFLSLSLKITVFRLEQLNADTVWIVQRRVEHAITLAVGFTKNLRPFALRS